MTARRELDRRIVVGALGFTQILAWGTSFYFPAVFAGPIVNDTGWPLTWVVSGTSIGLLIAGLISPQVGKLIDIYGGRPVILVSAPLNAAGLIIIGLAPSLPTFLIGWVIVGLAMGTGTYDAVFAALGRTYGNAARTPITNLTLIGGFASTVCWPLGAFLIAKFGWREACFIYAAIHIVITWPLFLAVLHDRAKAAHLTTDPEGARFADHAPMRNEALVLAILAAVMSIIFGVGSVMIVYLLLFLQERGVDFAIAVALGTLYGPSQIAARVVERLFGGRYHPLWTLIVAVAGMAAGMAMLYADVGGLFLAILIYAGAFGVSWVARGTVPLALFGPRRYPRLIGKLALPSLIAQAAAPSIGAVLIERYGANSTIGLLTAALAINVVLVALLWLSCRRQLAS
ncbi:MAG: MFS transporter [Pseudolabrys sp.]|nr:MFS transporter [Pseudolabrys sp.]